MLTDPIRPLLPGFPDWVAAGRLIPQCTLPQNLSRTLHFFWMGQQILYQDGVGPLLADGCSALPRLRTLPLGLLDGAGVLIHEIAPNTEAPPQHRWVGLRALFGDLDAGQIALAGRAFQLLEWDRSHQFCGRCGAPTEARSDERARVCTGCGHTAYPRISPVVMGLVVRGQELLLARSPHFAPGMYSAIAGFVEAGESLEQALKREILEESGIVADHFQYFDSQSWPFPHSLMVAYVAQYVSGSPVAQPEEIEDVRWFPLQALPTLPPPISIAGRLIRSVLAARLAPSHA